MSPPSPRALRVATLHDRLVLHDTTHHLRGRDPAARNALIDAANAATRASRSSSPAAPSLVDASPPPPTTSGTADRYLVIRFDGTSPFETRDVARTGIDDLTKHIAPVDAAAGFLGILGLHSASYAVVVSQIRPAGTLPSGPVMVVNRVKLFKLGGGHPTKLDRDFAGAVSKLLESGALYYSLDTDITRSSDKRSSSARKSAAARERGALPPTSRPAADAARVVGNAFWWTWPMARLGGKAAAAWALRTIYGFVGTELMRYSIGGAHSVLAEPGGRAASELALPDPRNPSAAAGAREFNLTLVSRRSRRRAGTRYITRGVDALGDVANFVETEQIVWAGAGSGSDVYTSFSVIRGSIPVFWRQINGIARPSPELDSSLSASRSAFSAHFRNMVRSYGGVVAVSLVDMHGTEAILADAFERHFELDIHGAFDGLVSPKLVSFDFHAHCGGKEYERGLATLLSRLQADVENFGFFSAGINVPGVPKQQRGVFRVNCVDCLDRTNVVQSMLARVALNMQLRAVFHQELDLSAVGRGVGGGGVGGDERSDSAPRLYQESEDRFKHVWGDNADAVSKQYSGTGALKTDFTRTGKRSTTGMMGDGVKSVVRMYYKNFVDEGRQEAIDILCGNANVHPTAHGGEGPAGVPAGGEGHGQGGASKDSSLWYSFEALRMNGGGDRQAVVVELRDDIMQLSTPEGVNVEYPRRGLATWDKCEESKSGDRKTPSRLRLIHQPSTGSPAAASPLDLLFRTGPTAREKFLRAYLSWSNPGVIDTLEQSVRVRVLSARGVSKHSMSDWGLAKGDRLSPDPNLTGYAGADTSAPSASDGWGGREVVALVLPEGHSDTREWGLAAVPVDVDDSNYVLISARAVSSRGPAIAVLASKEAAPSVMAVTEAMVGRAGSLTGGGAVGVSICVSGTSLCFVSARLGGAKDLFRVLSSLKLRRSMFDVTNQFEHFYIAGVMGDLQWRNGDVPADGPEARQFLTLGDGAKAYSLGNGLSVMRNSFPLLNVDDRLNVNSLWRQRKPGARPSSHSSESDLRKAKEFGADGAAAPFPGTSADLSLQRKASAGVGDGAKEANSPSDHPSQQQSLPEGPALAIEMIDEVVEGRPAPVLPLALSRVVVTLSELRGEGIKMPPGVDQSTPLNTFFAVYSDYVGGDAVVTRPTMRPTDRPEWREAIRLRLLPSGEDDVKRGFLLGQLLIPMPLAEPIPAGHCVLPIGYAGNGRAEFDIPLRLAGIATGRLCGVIELEIEECSADTLSNGKPGTAQADLEWPAGEDVAGGGSPVTASSRQGVDGLGVSGAGVGGFGIGPSLNAKPPSMDEVNEKFDQARRKGSKQIKSMVGKLSSLLSQSPGQMGPGSLPIGAGSRSGLPPAHGDPSGDYPRGGGSSGGRALGGLNPSEPEQSRAIGGNRDSAPSHSNESAAGTAPQWQLPPTLPNAPSPHASRANSRHSGTPDNLLAGLTGSGNLEPLSRRPSRGPAPSAPPAGEDPLLQSLSRAKSRPVDKRSVVGEDDLLAGLKAAAVSAPVQGGRAKAMEDAASGDDDWGAFEAAVPVSPQPGGSSAGGGLDSRKGQTSKGEENLIDF